MSDALLLDTHILLWAMSSPDRLSVRAARALNADPARRTREEAASRELDPLAAADEVIRAWSGVETIW